MLKCPNCATTITEMEAVVHDNIYLCICGLYVSIPALLTPMVEEEEMQTLEQGGQYDLPLS